MLSPHTIKQLTDVQLWGQATQFLETTYEEVQHYEFVLKEDLLTTGTQRFRAILAQLRGWSNRVLGMLGEATLYQGAVRPMAVGKRDLADRQTTIWLRDNRNNEQAIPRGLDAKERQRVAELETQQYADDATKWEELQTAMQDLRTFLQKRHSSLTEAKEELRMLLWSVRLQGVLGEGFGKSDLEKELGPETDLLKTHHAAGYEPTFADPGAARTGLPDTKLSAPDPELDELLKPH